MIAIILQPTGCVKAAVKSGWVARLPLEEIAAAEIDRLLGCVLSYSDDNFDAALALGFASAIRREWAWRSKRGESLANLAAFASLVEK